MVVVCVLYCDCDLTALLYLLLEVCSCAQHACTTAQENAILLQWREKCGEHMHKSVRSLFASFPGGSEEQKLKAPKTALLIVVGFTKRIKSVVLGLIVKNS